MGMYATDPVSPHSNADFESSTYVGMGEEKLSGLLRIDREFTVLLIHVQIEPN
jgi:hypothetical protein